MFSAEMVTRILASVLKFPDKELTGIEYSVDTYCGSTVITAKELRHRAAMDSTTEAYLRNLSATIPVRLIAFDGKAYLAGPRRIVNRIRMMEGGTDVHLAFDMDDVLEYLNESEIPPTCLTNLKKKGTVLRITVKAFSEDFKPTSPKDLDVKEHREIIRCALLNTLNHLERQANASAI